MPSLHKPPGFCLFLIMILIVLGAGAFFIYELHQLAIKNKREDLVHIVQSRARLIEAMARFDAQYGSAYSGGSVEATLNQLREAHKNFEGFGKTGEFALAKLVGDQIVFLLRRRHKEFQTPTPTSIPLNSKLAEPMRRALKGESGSIVDMDYRGQMVLAAYEPVKTLNLGLVAKIDLYEIKEPFIKSGIAAGVAGIIIIFPGTIIFFRISDSMARRFEQKTTYPEDLIRLKSQNELILKSVGEGIYGLDLEGKTTFCNSAAARATGYEVEELIGKNKHDLLHHSKPDGAPYPEEECPIYRTLREDRIYKGRDEVFWRKNGTCFPVEYVSTPIRENGKITGAVVIFRNTTERKRAEEELKQQLLVNKTITDNTASCLFMMNKQGHATFMNPAAERVTGYALDEIRGMPLHDAIHHKRPDGRPYPMSECPIDNAQADMVKMVDYEDIFVRKDGSLFPVICCIEPLEKDGEVIGSVLEFQDTAERKRSEEELKKARDELERRVEERTRELFEANQLMIAISRAQDKFIADADPHAIFIQLLDDVLSLTQSQYGFIGELLYTDSGKPYLRDVAIRSVPEKEEDFQRFFDENTPPNLEFYNLDNLFGKVLKTGKPVIANDPARDPRRGKTGSPKNHPPLDSYMGLPLYHGKEVMGMIAIANRPKGYDEGLANFLDPFLATSANIIEAYRIDQRRKQAEDKLNYAQKQILTSQKLAGIGQLAAGVSHEVLNPLNNISVHIQMLQRKRKDDSDLQSVCSKVRNEIKRIEKIIGSLLGFSRKGEPNYKEITVSKILQEVINLIEKDFSLENIKIEMDFYDGNRKIWADQDKMRQVFLNLAHNAKHAMPNGGTLRVKCNQGRLKDLDTLRITISDTGEGIKKEYFEKIFDPFFTTKEAGKGTGMGLYVVHGIIDEHRGTISVESEEGKGTTIIIDLPVSD